MLSVSAFVVCVGGSPARLEAALLAGAQEFHDLLRLQGHHGADQRAIDVLTDTVALAHVGQEMGNLVDRLLDAGPTGLQAGGSSSPR